MSKPYLRQLISLVDTHFNIEEFRDLCLDLNIDYDNLRGENKAGQVRELLLHLARSQQIPALLQRARQIRPSLVWPPVPADFQLPGAPTAPAEQPPAGGINIGGSVSGSGIAIGHGASLAYQGDSYQLSGDFRGAILNIRSILQEVSQHIGSLPQADEPARAELGRLVAELSALLETTPPQKDEEAQAVAEITRSLVESAAAEKPNRTMIRLGGETLKQAAQNLADVMPTVVTIAGQIVSAVLALGG